MTLRRNIIFGSAGAILPSAILFASFPTLINKLGAESFGLLILLQSINGSFSVLDMGLAAGTQRFLAKYLSENKSEEASQLILASTWFFLILGVIVLVALGVGAPHLGKLLWRQSNRLDSATLVIILSGIQFVFLLLINNFNAILKGFQRFHLTAVTNTSLIILSYGLSALYLNFFPASLEDIIRIFLAAYLLVALTCLVLVITTCKSLRIVLKLEFPDLRPLTGILSFSSLIFLNSISDILSVHAQRFVINSYMGPAAVATFTTANTAVSKFHSVLSAGFEALVPATAKLGSSGVSSDWRLLRSIYLRSLAISLSIGVIAMTLLFILSPILISWWLGPSISKDVTGIIQILCFGFAANSITPAIYHFINGIGKPGINTFFQFLGLAIFFSLILLKMADGVQLTDFAIALSSTYFINLIPYLVFIELAIWGKMLPKIAPSTQSDRCPENPKAS